MFSPRFLVLSLCAAASAALLAGCDHPPFDHTDRALSQAEQKQASGDAQSAANIYERALDGTAKTANTHFRLALLYDEKLGDAIGSIYHLHRYLALAPNGVHAKEARANLNRLEPILATSLAGGTLISRAEANRLKAENAELKKQIAERSVSAPAGGFAGKPGAPDSATGKAAARDAQRKPAPGSKSYVVQPGDTFAGIARKFYKNRARAKDIQDANLNAVPDPKKLKPGMTLIIPN